MAEHFDKPIKQKIINGWMDTLIKEKKMQLVRIDILLKRRSILNMYLLHVGTPSSFNAGQVDETHQLSLYYFIFVRLVNHQCSAKIVRSLNQSVPCNEDKASYVMIMLWCSNSRLTSIHRQRVRRANNCANAPQYNISCLNYDT